MENENIDNLNETNYTIASPLKRVASFVLDSFIVYPIYLIIYYIISDIGLDLGEHTQLITKGLYNLLFLIFLLTTWICFKGQSIGQLIMKIKIVSMDNKEITPTQALLRMFGWLACNITFGIGFLVMFFNKDFRGLHDFTSNSKVINI